MVQEPLLFFSCKYDDLKFGTSRESALGNMQAINALLDQQLARVALLQSMARKVESRQHLVLEKDGTYRPWEKRRRHIKLEKRGRESSLEDKLARFGKVVIEPGPLRINCQSDLVKQDWCRDCSSSPICRIPLKRLYLEDCILAWDFTQWTVPNSEECWITNCFLWDIRLNNLGIKRWPFRDYSYWWPKFENRPWALAININIDSLPYLI